MKIGDSRKTKVISQRRSIFAYYHKYKNFKAELNFRYPQGY
jgi:hypothetical protein